MKKMSFLLQDIVPQKRNPSRANLIFPEFVIGLSWRVVHHFSLSPGRRLKKREIEEILKKEVEEKVVEKGLKLLSLRPRSEKEMKRRLSWFLKKILKIMVKKNTLLREIFPSIKQEAVIKKVLKRFKKEGLVNDQEFVCWWLRQRRQFRPRSVKEIIEELRRKGVALSLIREGIVREGYQEEEAIRKLLEKKGWFSLVGEEKEKERTRLVNFLLRKGFSWEAVKRVIDEESNSRVK